ncbi:MAG TPA: hypothetical protein VHL11_11615 [Phototrophicaceae bacterium]|nr:hypothetical protein [Phototrophicaceae bacterium]
MMKRAAAMDLESATTMLYEDESLTGELVDEEAQALMKWAESQLPALLAKHTDEAAFDQAFQELRSMVKGMNRLVGRRQELDDTEKQERLAKLTETSTSLGFRDVKDAATAFTAQSAAQVAAQQTAALSNLEALHDLIQWVAPTAPAALTTTAQNATSQTADTSPPTTTAPASQSAAQAQAASTPESNDESKSDDKPDLFSRLKDFLDDKKA